jgi:hypothetical protein
MWQKILAAVLILTGLAAAQETPPSRDYDFDLFTFDQVNDLRRASLVDRFDIYREVTADYCGDISNAVNMRNYNKAVRLSGKLNKVLEYYVLEDIRRVMEIPDKRNKKELRKCEVELRKNMSLLRGAQRAVAYDLRPEFDPVLEKMAYCRRLLFRFINKLDGDRP